MVQVVVVVMVVGGGCGRGLSFLRIFISINP